MLRHLPAQSGVSAVEIIVVVAILGIAASVAVPSWSEFLVNNRLRTIAESTLSGLQLARTEAIRRNTNVTFSLQGTTLTGWRIVRSSDGTELHQRPPGEASNGIEVSSLNNQTGVTFLSTGRVLAYSTATNITRLDVDANTAWLDSGASRNLRLQVLAGGDIRLCDPNILTADDPRTC